MKKTTVIIVGLFAAVLAYYVLFEKGAKPAAEAAHDAKRLFSFEASQVETLKIVRPGGVVRVEATADRKWRMTDPIRARADRWTCDAVASALADLERQRELKNVKGQAGLAEMGLAPPRARVELTVAAKAPPKKETGGTTVPAGEGGSATDPESAASETSSPAAKAEATDRTEPGRDTAEKGPSPTSPSISKAGAGPGATAPRVLEIGSDVPGTGSVFVRIDGTDDIQLVPQASVSPLLKQVSDFRDHTLLDVMILDIHEARITRPEGDLRFRRHGETWWIESPISDLGDGSAIQNLLSSIVALRADSFVDDSLTAATGASLPPTSNDASRGKAAPRTVSMSRTRTASTSSKGAAAGGAPTPDPWGLDPPRASVRLIDKVGREIATASLGSPAAGQTDKVFARVRTSEGDTTTGIVANGSLSSLSNPASQFRSHKALAMRAWETSGLNLVSPGATLSFVKKDGVWSVSSPAALKVDATAVDDTLQAVADLEIVTFGAEGGSLASLGLDPPSTRIEVRSESPEGGLETLVLGGKAPSPDSIYARSPGRPGVFTVPASILDRFKGGASLYAAKTLPPEASSPSKTPAPEAVPH